MLGRHRRCTDPRRCAIIAAFGVALAGCGVALTAPHRGPQLVVESATSAAGALHPWDDAPPASASPAPTTLLPQGWSDPLDVGTHTPTLTWRLPGTDRGARQSAYQVAVVQGYGMPAPGAPVWITGQTASTTAGTAPWGGPPLASGGSYLWSVRTWDGHGQPSAWAPPAVFGVGLIDPGDWAGAQWLQGSSGVLMRKAFTVTRSVVSARLYAAAQGLYVPHLDGQVVGSGVLASSWTDWDQRTLVRAYDVTSALSLGRHVLGVELAQGQKAHYERGAPLFVAALVLRFANGSTQTVTTGPDWTTAPGPTVAEDPQDGETVDARRNPTGWDTTGFEALSWSPVTALGPAGGSTWTDGALLADPTPPIREVHEAAPRSVRQVGLSDFIVDVGTEIAGWAALQATEPVGTTVTLHYGEVLERGHVTTDTLEAAQLDRYTFRGDPNGERWEPQFSYHGFRYIEVVGLPTVTRLTVTPETVRSDVAVTGAFGAGNGGVTSIQSAVLQTALNSLHGLPEDAPTREKRGWGLDAKVSVDAALANADVTTIEEKWLGDIQTGQRPDGGLHSANPGRYLDEVDPAWGSAYPQVLWRLWIETGDPSLLTQHVDSVRRWVDYEGTRTDNHILDRPELAYGSDWLALEATPIQVIETVAYYQDIQVLAAVERILGQRSIADHYAKLARVVNAAFQRYEWDPAHQWYGNGSQGSQALPLAAGMVPADRRVAAVTRLVAAVQHTAYGPNHLLTGMETTQAVFRALTDAGRSDVLLAVVENTSFPGYGFMISHGPGTVWETWRVDDAQHQSHDHVALGGAVGEWFYTGLAGIEPQADGPGWSHIRIAPQVLPALHFANARVVGPHGTVTSGWRAGGGGYTCTVTLPIGTTATVVLPGVLSSSTVRESGQLVYAGGRARGHDAGVSAAHRTSGGLTLMLGAGHYVFRVTGAHLL